MESALDEGNTGHGTSNYSSPNKQELRFKAGVKETNAGH